MTTPTNRPQTPRTRVDPQRVGAVSAGERRRRPAWLFGLLGLLALALLALLLFLLLRHHGHKHAAVVPPPAAGTSPSTAPSSAPTPVATSAGNTGTGGTGTGGTGAGGVGGAALIGGGGLAAHQLTGTASGSGTSAASPAAEGTVLFPSGSAALDAQSWQVIAVAAARIKAQHSTHVAVTGYTDVVGGQPVNGDLSQQRADAVAAALRADLGGDTATISTASQGQADPVTSNSTAAGRQQNRRATITGT